MIIDAFHLVKEYCSLAFGSVAYNFWGKTPTSSYLAMIKLFCLTSGKSNDFISSVVRICCPKKSFLRSTSVQEIVDAK